jgi:hypothetical protein
MSAHPHDHPLRYTPVNGQTNVTGGARRDEEGVTLERQVCEVVVIWVMILGEVVGVVYHEDDTKEGTDEGEMEMR